MSDLGYTSSEQSSLHICYNDLSGYLTGVKEAISLSSEKFEQMGVKVDGVYQQLNSNVLQIENELYAPVRPKQVALTGEKPSEALQSRGVKYIEVRALDVNPFSDTGISVEQVYFLDIFLTYCLLNDSPLLDAKDQSEYETNMDNVVIRGRDPALTLQDNGQKKSIKKWGEELFDGMQEVAKLLDKANGHVKYTRVLAEERKKLHDVSLTPSAQILAITQEQSLTQFNIDSAINYRNTLLARDYCEFDEDYFKQKSEDSHKKQKLIEKNDELDFDQFLAEYFAK